MHSIRWWMTSKLRFFFHVFLFVNEKCWLWLFQHQFYFGYFKFNFTLKHRLTIMGNDNKWEWRTKYANRALLHSPSNQQSSSPNSENVDDVNRALMNSPSNQNVSPTRVEDVASSSAITLWDVGSASSVLESLFDETETSAPKRVTRRQNVVDVASSSAISLSDVDADLMIGENEAPAPKQVKRRKKKHVRSKLSPDSEVDQKVTLGHVNRRSSARLQWTKFIVDTMTTKWTTKKR